MTNLLIAYSRKNYLFIYISLHCYFCRSNTFYVHGTHIARLMNDIIDYELLTILA